MALQAKYKPRCLGKEQSFGQRRFTTRGVFTKYSGPCGRVYVLGKCFCLGGQNINASEEVKKYGEVGPHVGEYPSAICSFVRTKER
jgi:hypothetical protein